MTALFHIVPFVLAFLWSFFWRYAAFSLTAVLWIKIVGRKLDAGRQRFFIGMACLSMIGMALISAVLLSFGWYGALSAIFILPVTYVMIKAEADQNLRTAAA